MSGYCKDCGNTICVCDKMSHKCRKWTEDFDYALEELWDDIFQISHSRKAEEIVERFKTLIPPDGKIIISEDDEEAKK